MRTVVRRVADQIVVELDGDVDLASAPQLSQTLARAVGQAAQSGCTVTVDLDGAQAIDDTALGLLVGAAASARRSGTSLSVLCTGHRHLALLAETRLDQIIDVHGRTW